MDKQSKEQESQNRMDSIVALIMEEARSLKDLHIREAIYVVLEKNRARIREIMRTME